MEVDTKQAKTTKDKQLSQKKRIDTRTKTQRQKTETINNRYIENYTNPDNHDTFLNGVESTRQAVGFPEGTSYSTIATRAQLIKHARPTKERIDGLLDAMNAGTQVRLKSLTDIILGKKKHKTVTTYKKPKKDGKGTEITGIIETSAPPTPAMIIRANDTINKMTGIYDRNKAQAEAESKLFSSLMRSQLKDLRDNNTYINQERDITDEEE